MTSSYWSTAVNTTSKGYGARSRDVLAEIGLRLAPEKTQVVHIDEGFDFLSIRIQRHRQWGSDRHYVYSYPAKKALTAVRQKVKQATAKQTTNQSPNLLFQRLNYITRGWVLYHRHGAATTAFGNLHNYLWCRVWIWLGNKHPNRSRKWIEQRYYQSRWWPHTNEAELFKPNSRAIQRHRYRGNKIPTPWTHTTSTTHA